MEPHSLVSRLIASVRDIFAVIDSTTSVFQQKTGLTCISGCGRCCLSPNVEVFVSDMLPLAAHYFEEGIENSIYERLQSAEDSRCILYRPSPADPSKGFCSAYQFRPSLCRLFGFSTVQSRDRASLQLSTCQTIKVHHPDAVKKAESLLQEGDEGPHIRDFTLRIELLAPGSVYSESLPINRALQLALEKIACVTSHEHASPEVETRKIQRHNDMSRLIP